MLKFISFGYFCIPTVNKDLNKEKYVIREMFVRENVRSRKCHSVNCPSGKYSSAELSVQGIAPKGTVRWKNFFGELYVREKSVGEMFVGKVSVGKLS